MSEAATRRWFQFSIREAILAVALLAAFLAWLAEYWQFARYRRHAEAVSNLKADAVAEMSRIVKTDPGVTSLEEMVEIDGQRFHCTVWRGNPRNFDAPPAGVPRLSPLQPPTESYSP